MSSASRKSHVAVYLSRTPHPDDLHLPYDTTFLRDVTDTPAIKPP